MAETAVDVLIQALDNYLSIHGKRILSLIKLTKQKKVVIEAQALYRYFIPHKRYTRLEDVVKELKNKNVTEIGDTQISLKIEDGKAYLEVPGSYIKKIIK